MNVLPRSTYVYDMLLRNVENDDDEGNPEPVRCIGDFFSRLQIKRKHRLIEKKNWKKRGGGREKKSNQTILAPV